MLYFIKKKMIGPCLYMQVESTCVDVVLGRRLFGVVLTIIVPTLLLLAISHLTNFFKESSFDTVIAVNLTVMLVNTTMYVSITDNLPQTSYVKMIEIWMMFTLVVPFFEVFLNTYIDMLRVVENQNIGNSVSVLPANADMINTRDDGIEVDAKKKFFNKSRRLQFFRRLALVYIPVLEGVFVASFFFFGMKHYNYDV